MREHYRELHPAARMRHARIGRRRPFPTWDWKERAQRIDVAVVGRALDEPLRSAGAKDLHPQRVEPSAGSKPGVEPFGIDAPMIGMQCAQASLFVDGVEGRDGLPFERVGLNQRRPYVRLRETFPRRGDCRRCVVERRDIEAGAGERDDFISPAATGHEYAAGRERARSEPGCELGARGAAIPRHLVRHKALLPEFARRSSHAIRFLRRADGQLQPRTGWIGIIGDSMDRDIAVPDKSIKPSSIVSYLDQYVIGQEDAKKTVAVAVYSHFKKIAKSQRDASPITKSNILLIGSSGTGKTLLCNTLSRVLNVPFVTAEATSLAKTRYVNEEIEAILQRLVDKADGDIGRAQHGIVYIDEIDKLKAADNPRQGNSGESVQHALLKIMEGSQVKLGGAQYIDTTNILFICGGAFDGLAEF